tara:strand:+ start:95 stop:400 length:306 start_codon:yes stop_codon:yes gene_type:complete
MKTKFESDLEFDIINARYNDSVEDWILEDMIQHSMKPFFKWQTDTGCRVNFMQIWENNKGDYYPIVRVTAEFKRSADAGFFLTSFENLPRESLLGPRFFKK